MRLTSVLRVRQCLVNDGDRTEVSLIVIIPYCPDILATISCSLGGIWVWWIPNFPFSCDFKSQTWHGHNIMLTWRHLGMVNTSFSLLLWHQVPDLTRPQYHAHLAVLGYGKYLIVLFWYASAAFQACLVSPWYFGSAMSCQNTNHGPTKVAWYAAEACQKGTVRYKNYTCD